MRRLFAALAVVLSLISGIVAVDSVTTDAEARVRIRPGGGE